MLGLLRPTVLTISIGISVCLLARRVANADEKGEPPVQVEELRKRLTAAIGGSFEYLGGELGRTKAVGGVLGERFWFAKVRPKNAGEFAIEYAVNFIFPDGPNAELARRLHDHAVYIFPFKIGERGALRVVIANSTWGGSAYPHANVGDTLILPVNVDRCVKDHAFTLRDVTDRPEASFFKVAGYRRHEDNMKRNSAKPVVRNDAADMLELLASWGDSTVNRSLTRLSNGLTAYLEFKRPGQFDLAGRLADQRDKADMPKAPETPIHVLPKDQSVTVLLEYVECAEHQGQLGKTLHVTSSGNFPPGTIEARVGDRVVLGCGGYWTPANEKQEGYRLGLVEIKKFAAVEPYTPETKK